jgi:hypothetical protein
VRVRRLLFGWAYSSQRRAPEFDALDLKSGSRHHSGARRGDRGGWHYVIGLAERIGADGFKDAFHLAWPRLRPTTW